MNQVIHVSEIDQFPGAVYVGRKSFLEKGKPWLKESPLANPYKVGGNHYTREEAIWRYEGYLSALILAGDRAVIEALIASRDRPLACWCRRSDEEKFSGNACHADVVAETMGRFSDDELRAIGGIG